MGDVFAEWRRQQADRIWALIARWIIGLALMIAPFPMFAAGWLNAWFTPFLVLLGCIIVAPDIAGFISNSIGSPLWSRTRSDPPPLYSIPESLAAKGKYVEAEQEYEKIIAQFPNEPKPYIDLIEIAIMRLQNEELAGQFYQLGIRNLQDENARQTLTSMYERIRSRLGDHAVHQKPIRRKAGHTPPARRVA